MTNEHMLPLKLSFLALTFTIFFGSLLALPTDYSKCSHLLSCGSFHNIGYPFWGFKYLRPRYCGLPDFKLECPESNDYPTLHFDEDEYQLVKMMPNYSILKLQQNAPSNNNCLFHVLGNVLDDALSDHTPTDQIIISLFKCQKPIHSDKDAYYPCPHNSGVTYCRPLPLSVNESSYQFCTFIQITASRKELKPVLEDEAAKRMLGDGFEMDFPDYNHINCKACENSGGICVSGEDFASFLCYCMDKNKTYAHVCPNSGKLKQYLLKIALPVGSFFILGLLLVGFFYLKKKKLRSATLISRTISDDDMRSDLEIGSLFFGVPVFSYTELREATNGFDPDRVLGDGGFGIVYHGKLKDGREVAVKRLYERNYKRVGQFRNEVEILTKLKHPNLVTLYGCTSRHSRELLLVYEYISNGTVADHLYGDRSESTSLTWTVRMKIAVQTAEALAYLHASDVIHRDVKTDNILLDSYLCVKVADFGLSRLFPLDASHVSTAPQGTPGYLDPEYRKCYQVTSKSDVYSFGVVLIELISSLPAIDFKRNESEVNLSCYAVNRIQQGALDELVDQKIGFGSDFKVNRMVTLVAELAFQCIQQEKEVRPSMEEVLEALKKIEGLDYEALEAEEMSRGLEVSKPGSVEEERGVELSLRAGAMNPRTSPRSVIVSWASRSTVASNNTS